MRRASSLVRKSMRGTTFEQISESRQWYVVDLVLTADADPGPDQFEYCDPDRIVTYILLSGRYRRFEFDVKPGESQADSAPARARRSCSRRGSSPGST